MHSRFGPVKDGLNLPTLALYHSTRQEAGNNGKAWTTTKVAPSRHDCGRATPRRVEDRRIPADLWRPSGSLDHGTGGGLDWTDSVHRGGPAARFSSRVADVFGEFRREEAPSPRPRRSPHARGAGAAIAAAPVPGLRGGRSLPGADVPARRVPVEGHRLLVAPQDRRHDPSVRSRPDGRYLHLLRTARDPVDRPALDLPGRAELGIRPRRGRRPESGQVRDHLRGRPPPRHREAPRMARLGDADRLAPRAARAGGAHVCPPRDPFVALSVDLSGRPVPDRSSPHAWPLSCPWSRWRGSTRKACSSWARSSWPSP